MIGKLVSELFDGIADLYQAQQVKKAPAMPDLSDRRIDHLISDEELGDPALLYPRRDEVPGYTLTKAFSVPGMDVLDGEFPSPIETPFPINNTVHVRHFRLTRHGDGGPTIIMVPGWRMNDFAFFDIWCWQFAAWGYNSVLIDIPYHMQRTPEGCFSGQIMLTEDTRWSVLSLKQCFAEVHLLANRLRADGAPLIGTFGVSFGAFIAGLYVCQAENADFSIMGMPPMEVLDTLQKTHLAEGMRKLERQGVSTMLTDKRIPRIFNMCEMDLKVPRENVFIAMGWYDRLVDPQTVRDTAERWGGLPWLKMYDAGHISTFAMNPKFYFDLMMFLREKKKRMGSRL